jgi:predicted DNA-binding antitoxin AbrB/MazE fold protein
MVAKNDSVEFEAIFENGVLRPISPLTLPEHARVRLIVTAKAPSELDEEARLDEARRRLDEMIKQSTFKSTGPYPKREELYDRH